MCLNGTSINDDFMVVILQIHLGSYVIIKHMIVLYLPLVFIVMCFRFQIIIEVFITVFNTYISVYISNRLNSLMQ